MKQYFNLKRISDGKEVAAEFDVEETPIEDEQFYRVTTKITEVTPPKSENLEPGNIVETSQVKIPVATLDALVLPGFKKEFDLTKVNGLINSFGYEILTP